MKLVGWGVLTSGGGRKCMFAVGGTDAMLKYFRLKIVAGVEGD